MITTHGRIGGSFEHYYYRAESLRQLLLFAVVVSLVDRAISGSFSHHYVRVLLAGLAVGAVALSFSIHSGEDYYSLLRTKVGRDLSFVAVLINLALWTLLISRRTRDRELLLLTGALGLQFTGEAIGQSLRQVAASMRSHWVLLAGNLMLVLPHILRLFVWWQAFRRQPTETCVAGPDRPPADREPQSPVWPSQPRASHF